MKNIKLYITGLFVLNTLFTNAGELVTYNFTTNLNVTNTKARITASSWKKSSTLNTPTWLSSSGGTMSIKGKDDNVYKTMWDNKRFAIIKISTDSGAMVIDSITFKINVNASWDMKYGIATSLDKDSTATWVNEATNFIAYGALPKTSGTVYVKVALTDIKYKQGLTDFHVRLYIGTKSGQGQNFDDFIIWGEQSSNTPPVVSIDAPLDNSKFMEGSTVLIEASASDKNGSVDSLEFYANSLKIGVDFTSPYSMNLINTLVGTYKLTAKAYDNEGFTRTSQIASVKVIKAPLISILSPIAGSKYVENSNLNITTLSSDIDGIIDSVEFFVNDLKVAVDYTTTFSYSWNNITEGNYTIIVKATDNDGLISLDTSNIIVEATVGILNPKINRITVLPNPTKDFIIINNINVNSEITISNLLGVKLFHLRTNNSSEVIDLTNYLKGIYIVEINSVREKRIFKIYFE